MANIRSTDQDEDAAILDLDLEAMSPRRPRRFSDRIYDYLGATKPLNLIAATLAWIALIAALAEWLG